MSASDTSPSTDQDTGDSTSVGQASQEARERLERHYREIEQTYDDTRARLEDFNEKASDFIRENPAICIAGAVAAGYVIGRLASRRWLT